MKAKLVLFSLIATLIGCSNSTKDTYVSACRAGGSPEAICTCVYNKLENTYGEEKLQFFIDNSATTISEAPQFMEYTLEAAVQCTRKE